MCATNAEKKSGINVLGVPFFLNDLSKVISVPRSESKIHSERYRPSRSQKIRPIYTALASKGLLKNLFLLFRNQGYF
jgi:hypothetical protein